MAIKKTKTAKKTAKKTAAKKQAPKKAAAKKTGRRGPAPKKQAPKRQTRKPAANKKQQVKKQTKKQTKQVQAQQAAIVNGALMLSVMKALNGEVTVNQETVEVDGVILPKAVVKAIFAEQVIIKVKSTWVRLLK